MLVVTEDTTVEDIYAAGRPDPLFCKAGMLGKARLLAGLVDAELSEEMPCGDTGIGYVPRIIEVEDPER